MGFIQALFLDIGGVLMTNGWDHALRKKTAETFSIDQKEMDERHHLVFELYEVGKMTFDEYLKRIIFFEPRVFTIQDVKQYIFEAVRPYEEMIHFVQEIKKHYNLKVAAVSNEGRELAIDRIRRFNLTSFVDIFVVSSFVHYRKPDPEIYRLAIDLVQVPPTRIAYIDDRPLLIEMSKVFGLQGVHHKNLESTEASMSLLLDKVGIS